MSAPQPGQTIPTLRWIGGIDGHLRLIDQTRLPTEFVEIECRDVPAVWEAIRKLKVRGAPAIGIAAAFGMCLGIQSVNDADEDVFFAQLHATADDLATSRPTAVNLFWAIARMKDFATKRGENAHLAKLPTRYWPKRPPFGKKTAPCAGRSVGMASSY